MGSGIEEVTGQVQKVTSTGFVRSRLVVLPGGAERPAIVEQEEAAASLLSEMRTGTGPMITTESFAMSTSVSSGGSTTQTSLLMEARVKGYEGESCGECGNFTLVRNGTCMKCNTCGAPSGCS